MYHSNLNMRQLRWFDVVTDYDYEILYHTGKTNVVDDALSRKTVATLIRDIHLRKTLITLLFEQIYEARFEVMKEEHRKSDCVVG